MEPAARGGVSSQSPTAAGRSGGLHAHVWLHPQLRRKAPGGAKSGGQGPRGGASRMSQQQPGGVLRGAEGTQSKDEGWARCPGPRPASDPPVGPHAQPP